MDRKEGAVERRVAASADNRSEAEAAAVTAAADNGRKAEAAPVGAARTSTPAPSLDTPMRPVSRTLRPEGMEEEAAVAAPAVADAPPKQEMDEAGMSRLMAAKLRARQRQNPEDDA